jgi:hypothetical protein
MLGYKRAVSKAASQDLHPHMEHQVGQISGTLRLDLSRNDENRQGLSRRLGPMRGAFDLVKEMLAQDPAYRPTFSDRMQQPHRGRHKLYRRERSSSQTCRSIAL